MKRVIQDLGNSLSIQLPLILFSGERSIPSRETATEVHCQHSGIFLSQLTPYAFPIFTGVLLGALELDEPNNPLASGLLCPANSVVIPKDIPALVS